MSKFDNVGNRRTLTETIAAIRDIPTGAYLESDGLVVIEAENGTRSNGQTHDWLLKTTLPGYTGTSYLQTSKDTDGLMQTEAITTSPKVEYPVSFTTTETYTVWVRGYAANAAGDSAYVQVGNKTVEVTGFAPRKWDWAKMTLSGDNATLPISGNGVYTVSLLMREDGLRIDRLLLTTDTTYLPTDFGPIETERLTDTTHLDVMVDRVIEYDYDNLYRLTSADYSTHSTGSGQAGESYAYAYDPVGNRLQQIIDGDTTEYLYDAANRLESVDGTAYTFDANGNLLNTDVMTNVFDSANRLVESSRNENTIQPLYNGVNDRVGQTVGLSTTHFALDVAAGLPEVIYTSEGNAYLHLPGVIITESSTGETRYLLSDGLGSVRQAVDETGSVVAYNEFDPYGNPVQNGSSPYGFTGEWWQDEVELLHLRARWYSVGTGTFLSRDAWEGDIHHPLSLNSWSYVEGNPILYRDPSGHCRGLEGELFEACAKAVNTIATGVWAVEEGINKPIRRTIGKSLLGNAYLMVSAEATLREGCTTLIRNGVPSIIGVKIYDASAGGDIVLVGKEVSASTAYVFNWYSMEAGVMQQYNDNFVLTTPTGVNAGVSQQLLVGHGATSLKPLNGQSFDMSGQLQADEFIQVGIEAGFSVALDSNKIEENYPKFPRYEGRLANSDDILYDDISNRYVVVFSIGPAVGLNTIPNTVDGNVVISPGTNNTTVHSISGPEVMERVALVIVWATVRQV
ncbi:MAG: RHS repeat-associated core domain-containing protein [Ketobacter sp.]|nr:RHS repeat-associated core domain-containing protein [Ketobacter sp.]